jgi:hypothetical protein
VEAVSTFIHTVSVVHSADHHGYGQEPISRLPLRLRVPPPASRRSPRLDRGRLVWKRDVFRQWLARRMYFEPSTVVSLVDVKYGFDDSRLQADAAAFRQRLLRLDRKLPRRFIPLERIASSIQF